MSTAKVELGRRLFYDTRLSGNQTYACASCHQQARAFTDGLAHAIGSTGHAHPRSAMALANVAFNTSFGWASPALTSLEAQIAVPMFNEHPVELGLVGRMEEVVGRFTARQEDVQRFHAAFPDEPQPVSAGAIVKAIAAFERTLVSGDSPFDRYLYRDDRAALGPSAVRGMTLFFSARLGCATCHSGFNLSGAVASRGGPAATTVFHNTALYDADGHGSYPATDRGLLDATGHPADMGRFRAPSLRNIAVTAPYMHDGSLPTLEAVLQHYARGGHASRYRSDRIRGFAITPGEVRDLLDFFDSLTDEEFLRNPAHADPRLGDTSARIPALTRRDHRLR